MANIFESLRKDHDRQRELAKQLVATEGDSEARSALFDELSKALEAHAIAEERHFYVPLMQLDLTQEKARHSVAEHKELDDYVAKLKDYEPSASQWLITARELQHHLEHHLDEEEHEVFQLAGKALGDAEKSELGSSYEEEMADQGQPV